MNKKSIILLVVLVLIVIIAGFFVKYNSTHDNQISDQPIPTDIAETIQVRVGEKFVGQTGTEITVKQVVEDSRCPANANCVWAGRVVVKADVGFDGAAVSEQNIESNKPLELPEGTLTLTEVGPAKILNQTIEPKDYLFTFEVKR